MSRAAVAAATEAPTLLTGPPSMPGRDTMPPSLSPQKVGAAGPTGRFQVLLLGASGVGKTALARRILGQDVSLGAALTPGSHSPSVVSTSTSVHSPTIGVDFSTRSVCLDGGKPVRLHMWDASGQPRFKMFCEDCLHKMDSHDAVVLVYSAADSSSLEEACALALQVAQLAKGQPQMALVATKADVEPREVDREVGRSRAAELGISIFLEVKLPTDEQAEGAARAAAATPRNEIEAQLLRPLLRQCREQAASVEPRWSMCSEQDAAASPSRGKQHMKREARSHGASTPRASASLLACTAMRRCLRFAA